MKVAAAFLISSGEYLSLHSSQMVSAVSVEYPKDGSSAFREQ
jgi:hypothetical protein